MSIRSWSFRRRPPQHAEGVTRTAGPRRQDEAWVLATGLPDARVRATSSPFGAGPAPGREGRMVVWAGGLVTFYGAAHTLGALTVEGAARHAGAWFGGRLWGADLSSMSPAMSAYWLSVNSFGPPLVLLGLVVSWVGRRGGTPPLVVAWSLAGWVLLDIVVAGPGVGQDLVLLVAVGLLVAAARRAA